MIWYYLLNNFWKHFKLCHEYQKFNYMDVELRPREENLQPEGEGYSLIWTMRGGAAGQGMVWVCQQGIAYTIDLIC